jgi:sugar transferase (PEP-CTERM system associated)
MIRVFNQYVSVKGILLAVLESLIVVASLLFGASLRFWNDPASFDTYVRMPVFGVQALIVAIIVQLCFYYNELYDFHTLRARNVQMICLGQSVGQACILLGILYFLIPGLMIGRGVFLISMMLGTGCIAVSRLVLESTWPVAGPRQRILILGTGALAGTVARQLTSRSDLNVQILGFVRPGATGPEEAPLDGYKLLGGMPDLESIASATQVGKIIVAMEERRNVLPIRELVRLRVGGAVVEDAHTTMSALTGRVWLETIHPSWFVFSEGFHRSSLLLAGKRLVDLLCATLALLISLPLMLLLAIAIRLDSKGPVIYRQRRVGLGGRYFDVLKLRSMYVDAEQRSGAQWASVDDPRITRVGRYLRKFRLDEFPQFINVIRGDMSFVGPRPERPEFVEQLRKTIAYYDERHTTRPGLTGWAQVQYSYGASVEDSFRKLEYDLFYLKHMSIMFDLAIIFQTLRIVVSARGGR